MVNLTLAPLKRCIWRGGGAISLTRRAGVGAGSEPRGAVLRPPSIAVASAIAVCAMREPMPTGAAW